MVNLARLERKTRMEVATLKDLNRKRKAANGEDYICLFDIGKCKDEWADALIANWMQRRNPSNSRGLEKDRPQLLLALLQAIFPSQGRPLSFGQRSEWQKPKWGLRLLPLPAIIILSRGRGTLKRCPSQPEQRP